MNKSASLQQQGLNTHLAAPEGGTAHSAPLFAANDTGGKNEGPGFVKLGEKKAKDASHSSPSEPKQGL